MANSKNNLASVVDRGIAAFIDSLIVYFPGFIVVVSLFIRVMLTSSDNFLASFETKTNLFGTPMLVTLLISIIYSGYCTAKTGQTFGKRAMKIKVVWETSNQPSKMRMWIREFSKFGISIIPQVGSFLPFVSVILVIATKKKQALHDLIVSTRVIKSETSVGSLGEVKKAILVFYILSFITSTVIISGVIPALR